MNNLRVNFDRTNGRLNLSATGVTGECRVVVTYPDGIELDLGRALDAGNGYSTHVQARTDADGSYMEGMYSFLFERYEVGGNTPTSEDSGSIDLSFPDITVAVTNLSDPFAPLARLSEDTAWPDTGEWVTDTVTRDWDVSLGTRQWNGVQKQVTMYDNGYRSGQYSWSVAVTVGFDNSNGWVTATATYAADGIFDIYKPPTMEAILSLFSCLYSKVLAKDCCKDAQYEEMFDDYVAASAMLNIFVLNGQAGITQGQAELLFGSDCQPGILGILKKWGCYDSTLDESMLSAFVYCLCSSSGGGGTAATTEGYFAGAGCWIVSDATDDDDRWEFSKSSGVGTFTQNLAGSRIFGGTVRGTQAESTYNADGATSSFKLVIPVPGENANEGYASLLLANCDVFAAQASDPTVSARYTKRYGDVEVSIEDISDGTISFVFANIGSILSGGWAIVFRTPY